METVDNTEVTHDIKDLLIHAIEKRPNEFQDTFNSLLTQRISDRLDAAKKEVAANYFNYTNEDEGEEETETEEQQDQEQEVTSTDEVEQNGQDAETV